MILKTVFVRFYKSFNFDYLRKFHGSSEERLWEDLDGMWYPFVRIPIDEKVTTIVGANESGKSHLLTAIEKGVTGVGLKREDFCRYSNFFAVEKGKLKWSDFGFEWVGLSETEKKQIGDILGVDPGGFNSFLLFRSDKQKLTVYLPDNKAESSPHVLNDAQAKNIEGILPYVFRINADVALPDSVPIRALARQESGARWEGLGRQGRFSVFDLLDSSRAWFTSKETVTKHAETLASQFSDLLADEKDDKVAQKRAELELARDLICNVANVDPQALDELYDALRDGKEGHANGIIDRINDRLEASLNFPGWWVQDRNFRLRVSPREFDLVFTIRDRTETEYSFSERSSGLKYFLSYYVQYRAHKPVEGRAEILLMDEPDAYLSSQAQQDLLKIFDAFATPEPGRKAVQVIYVTHSPFLIDKNHSERIRVLEKGVADEGTRVVKDAARNHYEPLRSAFGAFVGETTFIGNSNLMVEGLADQILLAGAATYLRSKGVSKLETLDLNRITVVPAGSASQIPYLVYLARGRDVEKPPVVVLLDSDSSGNEARAKLLKGPYKKKVLKEDNILQIGDLTQSAAFAPATLVEIEDLIPIKLAVAAVQRHIETVCELPAEEAEKFTEEGLTSAVANKQLFDAVTHWLHEALGGQCHIEKVGFARSVIETINDLEASADDELGAASTEFETNMRALFKRIDTMVRAAERELSTDRISQKVNRMRAAFLRDYPSGARREQAYVLFEDLLAALGEDIESDAIRTEVRRLRRDFDIDKEMTKPIDDYENFKVRLEGVRYAGRIATQEAKTVVEGMTTIVV